MSRRVSYEGIVQTLYNSITEPVALSEFLELTCAATDSHTGALHVDDFRTCAAAVDFIAMPRDIANAYNVRYADQSILMHRAASIISTGLVCSTSGDLVSLDALRSSLYWREFLSLIDVEHCLGLCGVADADDLVMLSLSRSHSEAAYDEHDRDLMRRISPHWVNAFRIRRQLGTLHDTMIALEAALDKVTLAVAFLDGAGQVTRVNHGAERMLARGDVVALRRGRLVARQPSDVIALHRAIAAALHVTTSLDTPAGASHKTPTPQVLHDARGNPVALVGVHPLALREAESAHTTKTHAVVFVRPLVAGNACSLVEAAGELFGLTTAEARLAVSLLSTGDLAHTAQQTGVTADAARSRLKIVFDKTGAHGQPALVHLLSELSCVIGAG